MVIRLLAAVCRMTATKFMVLEDGGQLPPLPLLTHLVDKEYGIYEREVNNWEGTQHVACIYDLRMPYSACAAPAVQPGRGPSVEHRSS